MGRFMLIFLALSSTIFLQINAQTFVFSFCFGDYAPNTTFDNNLNLLLSTMSKTTMHNNTATVGREPNTVFGLFQCRADLSSQDCKKCAETATRDVKIRCPYKREIYMWYDECLLRYNNNIMISIMVVDPKRYFSFAQNVSDPFTFRLKLNELMGGLVAEAVNSTNLFAVGEANVTNYQRIYGLVQCTQDISSQDCERCLTVSINQIPPCCDGKDGGRILKPSCVLWFEVYKFFSSNDCILSAPPDTNIPSGNTCIIF